MPVLAELRGVHDLPSIPPHTPVSSILREMMPSWNTNRRISVTDAARKHMNAGGVMHGGCLMSFADFSLFSIAAKEMEGVYGATVAFNCEFLQGPVIGDLMEARGEVLRAGKSIIFVRGIITGEGKPCLNFSGTIKKFKPRN